MPPLLHNHYERTCRACRYSWVVTRGEAALHQPSINRFEALGETHAAGRVEVSGAAAIGSVEAEEETRLESYEEMRRCPSCGIDDFTERPVTKAHSADDPAPGAETGGSALHCHGAIRKNADHPPAEAGRTDTEGGVEPVKIHQREMSRDFDHLRFREVLPHAVE